MIKRKLVKTTVYNKKLSYRQDGNRFDVNCKFVTAPTVFIDPSEIRKKTKFRIKVLADRLARCALGIYKNESKEHSQVKDLRMT
jgi:putative ubiquitin-RnfH superfamily antitoxin RatB of RatAB toxin-antitoxin module